MFPFPFTNFHLKDSLVNPKYFNFSSFLNSGNCMQVQSSVCSGTNDFATTMVLKNYPWSKAECGGAKACLVLRSDDPSTVAVAWSITGFGFPGLEVSDFMQQLRIRRGNLLGWDREPKKLWLTLIRKMRSNLGAYQASRAPR